MAISEVICEKERTGKGRLYESVVIQKNSIWVCMTGNNINLCDN